MIVDTFLAIDNADDEGADDVKSGLTVMLGSLSLDLDEVVPSEEELRDVSSVVVSQVKLAARVIAFVAIQVKHKVVEDDE